MNTSIANTVTSTDQISKYDNAAKKLLSQKIILAHLLVKTVDEFSGMDPEEVVDYIEGEIYVEKVPVEPGMTNYPIADDKTSDASTDSDENGDATENDKPVKKAGALVVGLNTEQNEIQEDVINSYQWEGDLDLMNIVMIGLTKELPQFNDEYELHRLIGTVLTDKLSPKEKLEILKYEYNIPIEESLDKEVQEVGSLGQGIYDEAKEEGKKEGREEGREETTLKYVLNMHKDNMPINKIAEYVSKSIEEVKAIIEAASMTTA